MPKSLRSRAPLVAASSCRRRRSFRSTAPASLRRPSASGCPRSTGILFVREGGLVSYGVNPGSQFANASTYVDRILNGAKAGDLPVQAPTKFELAINLNTARAQGLTIPEKVIATADEVIE